MEVPWGQAIQIGAVGFGTVFVLLVILGIVVWITGLVVSKASQEKAEASNNRKGE